MSSVAVTLDAVAPSPNNIAIFIVAYFALSWAIMPLLRQRAECHHALRSKLL
jgi:hypothetical protein